MKTTNDFLDELKKRKGFESDYQLAQELGWPTSRISHYRAGRRVLDDETAVMMSEILGVELGWMLTLLHAERAERLQQTEIAKALQRVARKVAGVVMPTALAIGAAALGMPSPAAAGPGAGAAVYYVKRRRWLEAIFPAQALKDAAHPL